MLVRRQNIALQIFSRNKQRCVVDDGPEQAAAGVKAQQFGPEANIVFHCRGKGGVDTRRIHGSTAAKLY
jgi:hypothetical protein